MGVEDAGFGEAVGEDAGVDELVEEGDGRGGG